MRYIVLSPHFDENQPGFKAIDVQIQGLDQYKM